MQEESEIEFDSPLWSFDSFGENDLPLAKSLVFERANLNGVPEPVLSQLLQTQWAGWSRSVLDADDVMTRVIVLEHQRIGLLCLRSSKHKVRIHDFAILARFQNQGVGRAVLGALQRESDCIELRVQVGSRARRLYERAGFVFVSTDGLDDEMIWRGRNAESGC